ncbi:MAG: tetratricopeptide repeat protein, partial [bacterium]
PKSEYSHQALRQLGGVYVKMEKNEKAIEAYKEYLNRYPESEDVPAVLMNLAWRYRLTDKEKEKEILLELNRRFPNTEFGWFALGLYYEECGEAEKAIEPYKKAAEFHGSQRPLALLNLGGRYSDIGKYRNAIQTFEELMKEYGSLGLGGIEAEALWYIGRCYEHIFDYQSAIKAYFRLLKELSPDELGAIGRGWYEDAKFSIGYCYLQLGEYEKAFNVWKQLLEEAKPESDMYYVTKRVLHSYEKVISPVSLPPRGEAEGDSKLVGPIYGIFMDYKMEFRRKDRIIIVYGTGNEREEDNRTYEDFAQKVKEHLEDAAVIKGDEDVSMEEKVSKNLVLIGTPQTNRVLREIGTALPIKIGDETIQVANRIYKGKGIGIVMVAPNPFNKELFVLVYSAFEPSVLRNIFSVYHGGTDYIVFSKESLSEGSEPDPNKPSLEEGYFLKNPNKWEPFPSK